MNKSLIVILAAIGCAGVSAQGLTDTQNICKVPEPYVIKYYQDIGLAGGTLQCGPPPRGTGINLTVRGNSRGIMVWYYCKGTDNKYRPTFGTNTWEQLTSPTYVAEMMVAYNAPDIVGGVTAFAKKYFTVPLATSPQLPIFCEFQKEMYTKTPEVPPLVPPTYAFKVRANSTLTTRPYYRVTNGVRSLTIAGQATVGADCDPSKAKIVESISTYMAFAPNFDPSLVTVCVPK